MAHYYVVSAQRPTAILSAVTGNFTAPNDLNLIVNKCTSLEIFSIGAEGLQSVLDIGIYGRIATLQLFRPQGEAKDLIFLVTERYKFCVLTFDTETREIITKANGDVSDKVGRPADNGQLCTVDPLCRLIGLHLYEGLFKVIPMDPRTGQLKEAINMRVEELHVLDVKFLHGPERPTVALLYQDAKEARHVKTYEVAVKEKELRDGPWSLPNVEAGATFLIAIPAPFGGVVVVGEQSVAYYNGESPVKSLPLRMTVFTAYGRVDREGTRYLLTDHVGKLFLLLLRHDAGRVTELAVEMLGETSIASCVAYLDRAHVFIGSQYGDSQLVRFAGGAAAASPGVVEVMDTYVNLGPIVDMAVVDLERQGQGVVVTASGAYKDGSLRVIRNGIGITELAAVELPGIKGMWALRASPADPHDKYLVVAFVGSSLVLAAAGPDELEETELAGLDTASPTLYCGNVVPRYGTEAMWVQATDKAVRLVVASTGALVGEWRPPAGHLINVACGNPAGQVVVATGGGHIVYLEVAMAEGTPGPSLKEVAHAKLESEVACLSVSPVGDNPAATAGEVAVGLWDVSVRLLQLPSLSPRDGGKERLGGETIARSLLFATLEGVDYLLCGLGDGHLVSFVYHPAGPAGPALTDRKKVPLGTQPLQLRPFATPSGTTAVFASSDRPTVVYSSNRKLLYSHVNLKEVVHMAPFAMAHAPDSLALATGNAGDTLTIGTIDAIQKLHVRTVSLHGEMPRRLCHQEASRSFAVLTIATTADSMLGLAEESAYVRLVDDTTFEIIAQGGFALDPYESGCSITSMSFLDEPATTYYVVGTAYVLPNEVEPTKGRILVFRVVGAAESGGSPRLQLVAQKEVRGAVYNLQPFNGRLVAGVNSRVILYSWSPVDTGAADAALRGFELKEEAVHHGHILALYLATRSDFVLVGDLMKSVTLLAYRGGQKFEELARDWNPNWMTALAILDDDHFLGAENAFNLFVVRKNSEAATDEERSRLDVVAEYHLGEFVNRFQAGSLVMKPPAEAAASAFGHGHYPTLLYGTVHGSLGVIATLPPEEFHFFQRLQQAMTTVIKGVGGFKHSDWRSFHNDRRTSEAKGFIDGDLIESFLDLRREKMVEVAARFGTDCSVEELCRRIETLQQALH